MITNPFSTVSRLAFATLLAVGALPPTYAQAEENPATNPVPRDSAWVQRHDTINANVISNPESQLLFIGDSITQAWNGPGKSAWSTFETYKPLNLGIGGDRTEHVLWRLDNGNLSGLSPKVAVVMIGTNNSNGNAYSAENIAEGVTAIVTKLRTDLPNTKILLLAIFPRGETPNPQREKISEVNTTIAKLDDNKHIHYLDISPVFLAEDKSISKEIMPDFLHLSPKGYQLWADAIAPKIAELME